MIVESSSGEQAVVDLLGRLEADALGVVGLGERTDARLAGAARRLLPEAQSVVVVAMEMYPEVLAHSTPTKMVGEAALRDILAPHFQYLDGRLTKAVYDVAKASRHGGLRALPLPGGGCPVDPRHQAAVLSFKHAAAAAGMGTIGKSSLLLTPQFGPRVRLACVLTEARLAPTAGHSDAPCADCGICLAACPASALSEPAPGQPYSINKFACNAFRTGSGACSECLRVCPAGT